MFNIIGLQGNANKITVTYHFISTRRAILRKTGKYWWGEIATLIQADGNVKWRVHFRKQSGSSTKGWTELPYDPAIPLLNMYTREMKTYVGTRTCTQMFFAALFIIAKKWKQPKCQSTDKWINKMVHPYYVIFNSKIGVKYWYLL